MIDLPESYEDSEEWYNDCIHRGFEHISSPDCWCHPEMIYKDLVTGNEVWLHKEDKEVLC